MTCDSPAGKLGVTVCYDLRFPEMYQLLAWHMGAQIMLVPSAFTVATGMLQLCTTKVSLTAERQPTSLAAAGKLLKLAFILRHTVEVSRPQGNLHQTVHMPCSNFVPC